MYDLARFPIVDYYLNKYCFLIPNVGTLNYYFMCLRP